MKIVKICNENKDIPYIISCLNTHKKCDECGDNPAEVAIGIENEGRTSWQALCSDHAWKLADALNETTDTNFKKIEI